MVVTKYRAHSKTFLNFNHFFFLCADLKNDTNFDSKSVTPLVGRPVYIACNIHLKFKEQIYT